jgi:hypothetical protein
MAFEAEGGKWPEEEGKCLSSLLLEIKIKNLAARNYGAARK